MNENTFMNVFDSTIIQSFSQAVSPSPFQDLSFFPPTPPQQILIYLSDNVHHKSETSLIEDINNKSYSIETIGCNMNSRQSSLPMSLQVEHKNIPLTPSQSTETCSSSTIYSIRDIFQDFSLYPSNYIQHNDNHVDQSIALTTTNSGYTCNHVGLHNSPHFSCSPHTHCQQKFNNNTTDNKNRKTVCSKKKKHYCKICNRSFGRPQELQRHQVCHTGERNFFCASCTKSFARRDAMQRHYKSHFKEKTKNTTRAS